MCLLDVGAEAIFVLPPSAKTLESLLQWSTVVAIDCYSENLRICLFESMDVSPLNISQKSHDRQTTGSQSVYPAKQTQSINCDSKVKVFFLSATLCTPPTVYYLPFVYFVFL